MKRFLMLAALVTAMFAASVPAQTPEPLVIYNGRAEQFVRPLADRFTELTGVPVVLHAGSATELLNKLRVEGARSPADLYLSNDAGTLQMGEDADLFVELPRALLEPVPANLRGRGNGWVGLSARARVIVVHAGVPEAERPRSVFDLADPRWRGRVGLTNASNESFVAGLSVYQAAAGERRAEQWLRGLKANVGNDVYPRHGAVVADVAAGRRAVGLVNHYYVFRHLAQHPDAPIRMIMPDQGDDGIGTAWNVAGIAIPRHARNAEAARRFVEFALSEEGQRMFADANLEYPTRRGVAADPQLPPVDSLKVADVPLADLASRRDAAITLIDRVGMP